MKAGELISNLSEEQGSYQIESKLLMNMDSTNMQPESWVEIAEAIYENYDHYDGFVITHGTDTMAYTSAALSYMLQNLTKPIVVTGSQVPMIYRETDAKKNMLDAIRFACEEIGGVFIVFDGKVIQGTRAVKIRTKSYNAFESINYPYIAYINGSEVRYHGEIRSTEKHELICDTSLCPDVFVMKLYPGTKPELFDCLKQSYKGVIVESFGSGGIPLQGRNLLPKLKELIESGIAVVFTTQCLEEGEDLSLYQVGRKIAENMIIHARNMNTEAIVPKLMWALAKTNDLQEVKRIMETPIANDITQR
jgi:L-asparaginase